MAYWIGECPVCEQLQMKDGRSSRAYLDLFERLRGLKKAGQIADVAAIQPVRRQTTSETEFNAAMADRFRSVRFGSTRPITDARPPLDGVALRLKVHFHRSAMRD
jgi:hypothetical protein